MRTIAIVSLHFSPAFIGHMKAWYKLCQMCKLKPYLFIDDRYIKYFKDTEFRVTSSMDDIMNEQPSYAVVQNIGFENVVFFKWCKQNNCKILYILHEPYMGLCEILKDGTYCIKQVVASLLNIWLCKKSEKVIICSDYANKNCKKYMRKVYKKSFYMPLLFLNNYIDDNKIEREYISMIGGYAEAHGSDMFLKYAKSAYLNGSKQKFQIATRSNIVSKIDDPVFKKMIQEQILKVQQGRPLSEEEINLAYRSSIAVWNGYRRSTQSGVLANAFMQGTPVIATDLESFKEFVIDGMTGVYVKAFDEESIGCAISSIEKNFETMHLACRDYFLKKFYYRNNVDRLNALISEIDFC